MLSTHADGMGEDYWTGADLVMEVVSEDPTSQERDYEAKRQDYAEGGIAEYWIVDPQQRKITVLRLKDEAYEVQGEYAPGEQATSTTLPGFTVDVNSVLAAGTAM